MAPSTGESDVKFGVAGTSQWAEKTHLTGLAANPDITLVAVQGRNAERRAALAGTFGIEAFESFSAMLPSVDAVSFSLPPSVQADLAREAAGAGKHLLMEKPIAMSLADALGVAEAVERAGISAACFLTRLYVPLVRKFVERARAARPNRGAASFRSGALLAGPYAASGWRQSEYGALWDAAPHTISVLTAVLGPVSEVTAARQDAGGLTAAFRHESGATSELFANLRDPGTRLAEDYAFEGGTEPVALGAYTYDRPAIYMAAINELVSAVRTGSPHPSLAVGLHLAAVCEAAEEALKTGSPVAVAPTPGVDAVGTWPAV